MIKAYQDCWQFLKNTALNEHLDTLVERTNQAFTSGRWGEIDVWQQAINHLPQDLIVESIDLISKAVTIQFKQETLEQTSQIQHQAMQLHPWRKGPFQIGNTLIDTEWQSWMKWERIMNHQPNFKQCHVLDIGCGNGYYAWQMLGQGADMVLGVDPSMKFVYQWLMLKHFIDQKQPSNFWILPFGLEDLPEHAMQFDWVLSMGVLYHRRSPIDHLLQLKSLVKPTGKVLLETLIVETDATNPNDCLVPEKRYAKMPNTWFIPSIQHLTTWLNRAGFKQVEVWDISPTTTDEQRKTPWMTFESLKDFLAPNNHKLTIEGYPAPVRAVLACSLN